MGENLRITSTVEHITPTIARKYLAMNSNNPRRLNKNTAASYAEDMKAGKWELNGEAIVFDEEGNLRNGQHRLLAVIKADIGVDFLVVRGIAKDTNIYDMQMKRSISQELRIASTVEAVAAEVIMDCYRTNGIRPKGLIRDYIIEHEADLNLAYSISYIGGKMAKSRKRDIVLGIYLLIRTGYNIEELKAFFTVVNSGFPIENRVSTPAIVFAKMLDVMNSVTNRTEALKKVETLISALDDFKNEINRKVAYRISKTNRAEALIAKVRKMDNLTE